MEVTVSILDALYSPAQIQVGPDIPSRQRALANLLRVAEVKHLFSPRRVGPHAPVTSLAEEIAAWMATRLRNSSLKYISDPATCDLWQSPARTLTRCGGDCEDLVILGLAMLHHQGVESYMVTGAFNSSGHAWIEGRDNGGGFMIEATTGAMIRGNRTRVGFDGARPFQYRAITAITVNGYQIL
jgi:transglutaminase-like putative cysteine protease